MSYTAEAAKWIDLVLARVPELRAAGVLKLSLDGLQLELAPAQLVFVDDGEPAHDEPPPRDPLLDPATYARTEEEGVPGDDGRTRDPDAYEDGEEPPEDM